MMAADYLAEVKQSGLGFMTVGLYGVADFGSIFGNFADLTSGNDSFTPEF
jgi:hypothetical protein